MSGDPGVRHEYPHQLRSIIAYGLNDQPFQSLNRTRDAYVRAIEREFKLVSPAEADSGSEATLLFSSTRSITVLQRSRPVIIPVHGGAVVSSAILRRNVARLRGCDRLIINCNADLVILSDIMEEPEQFSKLIYLPINTDVFFPSDKALSRNILGIPFDAYVIGYVGRLIPQKGIHNLLRTVKACRDSGITEIYALIVGDFQHDYPILSYATASEYSSTLWKYIDEHGLRDRVVFLGGQSSDAALTAIYSACDVYVQVSHTVDENFGYSPLEAMACGVPVVATAYGGLRDTVVHGETGFLISTWATAGGLRSDIGEAVNYIKCLLLSSDLRSSMSRKCRAQVKEKYSEARFSAGLVNTFEEAMSVPKNAPPPALKSPRRLLPQQSFLPRGEPDWMELWPLAQHYAGGRAWRTHSRFLMTAPIDVASGRTAARCSDPAWPATYNFRPEEVDVLMGCITPIDVGQAITTYGEQILSALIDVGALLPVQHADQV